MPFHYGIIWIHIRVWNEKKTMGHASDHMCNGVVFVGHGTRKWKDALYVFITLTWNDLAGKWHTRSIYDIPSILPAAEKTKMFALLPSAPKKDCVLINTCFAYRVMCKPTHFPQVANLIDIAVFLMVRFDSDANCDCMSSFIADRNHMPWTEYGSTFWTLKFND